LGLREEQPACISVQVVRPRLCWRTTADLKNLANSLLKWSDWTRRSDNQLTVDRRRWPCPESCAPPPKVATPGSLPLHAGYLRSHATWTPLGAIPFNEP